MYTIPERVVSPAEGVPPPSPAGEIRVQEDRPACAPGRRAVHWLFPPFIAAVPEIRRRLREVLRAWCVGPEAVDTLLLVASELVANAVTHAAPVTETVRVAVGLDGSRVRFEVSDDDPFRPPVPAEAHAGAESGRGLFIVRRAIAEVDGDMHVLPRRPGKTVRVGVSAAV